VLLGVARVQARRMAPRVDYGLHDHGDLATEFFRKRVISIDVRLPFAKLTLFPLVKQVSDRHCLRIQGDFVAASVDAPSLKAFSRDDSGD
jgi:hypothetical protein